MSDPDQGEHVRSIPTAAARRDDADRSARRRAHQLRARRALLVRASDPRPGRIRRTGDRCRARRCLRGRDANDAGGELPADGRRVLVRAHDRCDDQRARGHGGRADQGLRSFIRPGGRGRRPAVRQPAARLRRAGRGWTGGSSASTSSSARRRSASSFRAYVLGAARAGHRPAGRVATSCRRSASGSSGLHLLFETPATIALRRAVAADAALARDLDVRDGVALAGADVLRYHPSRTFLEVVDPDPAGYGRLTISMLDPALPIPLLRYQPGDVARLVPAEAVAARCARRGRPVPANLPPMRGRARRTRARTPAGWLARGGLQGRALRRPRRWRASSPGRSA